MAVFRIDSRQRRPLLWNESAKKHNDGGRRSSAQKSICPEFSEQYARARGGWYPSEVSVKSVLVSLGWLPRLVTVEIDNARRCCVTVSATLWPQGEGELLSPAVDALVPARSQSSNL